VLLLLLCGAFVGGIFLIVEVGGLEERVNQALQEGLATAGL